MIVYRHFAPRRFKCPYCGYSPLEIWAFTWNDRYREERAEPCLVCTDVLGRRGCGTLFDPIEYNLLDEDLIDVIVADDITCEPIKLCLVTA